MIAEDGSANHLSDLDRLANTFSIMRHGQSRANVAGIIVSCIENDRRGDYGLSELGRKQALETAQACGLPRDTVIWSSDFARARQTAEILRAHLDTFDVGLAEALRERCFGEWEGSPTENYAGVWAADETDAAHARGGVEPVAAVLDRMTAFVVDLDRQYSGRDIVLVSHGDTLQILQAAFLRMSPTRHRSLRGLETAEIRRLRLKDSPTDSADGGGPPSPVAVGECVDDGEPAPGLGVAVRLRGAGLAGADVPDGDAQSGRRGVDGVDDGPCAGGRDGGLRVGDDL